MNTNNSGCQPEGLPRGTYSQLRLIIVLSVGFILGSIAAYTAWESYSNYHTLINAAELQTQGYARALKEHAERTFSEVDLVLQATLRQLDAAGGMDKAGQPALDQLLRRNAASAPQIASLTCIDRTGQMTAISTPNPISLPNVSNRQFYQFHRDNPSNALFINPPFHSKSNGVWRFTLSRRINTLSGEFAGIIVAGIDISYFEKLYTNLATDRNARYSLATIPGNYLILVPNAHHVYETGKQTNAPFKQRVAAASAQTYHVQRSNVFGEARIVSYRCLEHYPVVAIMSFNRDYVLSGWRAANIRTGLTTITFMLLVVFLVIQLLQQIKLLDHKVQERTALLSLANSFLENEIEERRAAEERLHEHQHRINQIGSELSLAEDRERGRIAGELHDQVGQRLILCKIKLDGLASEAACKGSLREIMAIETMVDQSLQDIRSLTFQLRPPVLANAGLLAALQWLGEELQRDYGLEVKFADYYEDTVLPSLRYEINSTLFQTVRELLLNVVKHADVAVAWLSLQQTEDLLLIKVIDNGRGFDNSSYSVTISRHGGFGMHNLKQKIEYLGGSFLIDTTPGMGTFVTISLPLKPDFFEV